MTRGQVLYLKYRNAVERKQAACVPSVAFLFVRLANHSWVTNELRTNKEVAVIAARTIDGGSLGLDAAAAARTGNISGMKQEAACYHQPVGGSTTSLTNTLGR
jgi:hypothetical protein